MCSRYTWWGASVPSRPRSTTHLISLLYGAVVWRNSFYVVLFVDTTVFANAMPLPLIATPLNPHTITPLTPAIHHRPPMQRLGTEKPRRLHGAEQRCTGILLRTYPTGISSCHNSSGKIVLCVSCAMLHPHMRRAPPLHARCSMLRAACTVLRAPCSNMRHDPC